MVAWSLLVNAAGFELEWEVGRGGHQRWGECHYLREMDPDCSGQGTHLYPPPPPFHFTMLKSDIDIFPAPPHMPTPQSFTCMLIQSLTALCRQHIFHKGRGCVQMNINTRLCFSNGEIYTHIYTLECVKPHTHANAGSGYSSISGKWHFAAGH